MKETSKDYAVALFRLACEQKKEEEILSGLLLVRKVFEETEGLAAFLRSPAISKQTVLDTLRKAFESEVHEYVFSFLSIAAERGDTDIIPECIEAYELLYHADKNVSSALVTSAVALTEEEQKELVKKLEKKSKKEVLASFQVDPSLLGGLIVEMDGMIMDGSLSHRLKTLKEVMDE